MSHKIPKPSTSVEVLPWDVYAEEILPRLPQKSLAKFKCVSKLWNSHISSPHFVRHLNPVFRCSSDNEKGFVFYLLRGNQFTKLERAPRSKWFYLVPVGSCHGTICFITMASYIYKYTILWNPSTKQKPLQEISLSNIERYPRNPYEFCAAIGHDSRTDDYKVVYFEFGRKRAYVYSLKGQAWKELVGSTGRLLPARVDIVEMTMLPQGTADGKRVHWLAKCDSEDRRRRMLVSFDMCDEAFGLITLPECLASVDGREHVELASLVGHDLVTLFAYDKELSSRTEYFVWVMKEYGVAESWTKSKISLAEPGRPLGYLDKYKFLFHLSGCEEVLLYDTMTEEKECIGIQGTRILTCVGNYMENQVKFSGSAKYQILDKPTAFDK